MVSILPKSWAWICRNFLFRVDIIFLSLMGIYHLMNILALRTKVGPKAFKCLFLYFISMNVRPLVDLKKN